MGGKPVSATLYRPGYDIACVQAGGAPEPAGSSQGEAAGACKRRVMAYQTLCQRNPLRLLLPHHLLGGPVLYKHWAQVSICGCVHAGWRFTKARWQQPRRSCWRWCGTPIPTCWSSCCTAPLPTSAWSPCGTYSWPLWAARCAILYNTKKYIFVVVIGWTCHQMMFHHSTIHDLFGHRGPPGVHNNPDAVQLLRPASQPLRQTMESYHQHQYTHAAGGVTLGAAIMRLPRPDQDWQGKPFHPGRPLLLPCWPGPCQAPITSAISLMLTNLSALQTLHVWLPSPHCWPMSDTDAAWLAWLQWAACACQPDTRLPQNTCSGFRVNPLCIQLPTDRGLNVRPSINQSFHQLHLSSTMAGCVQGDRVALSSKPLCPEAALPKMATS